MADGVGDEAAKEGGASIAGEPDSVAEGHAHLACLQARIRSVAAIERGGEWGKYLLQGGYVHHREVHEAHARADGALEDTEEDSQNHQAGEVVGCAVTCEDDGPQEAEKVRQGHQTSRVSLHADRQELG